MYTKYAKMRDARGVTDYEVAKQTGLSRSTLSDWKSGAHMPSVETLKKLAAYFGVTIDFFVNEGS